jgi:PRC-barrel domain
MRQSRKLVISGLAVLAALSVASAANNPPQQPANWKQAQSQEFFRASKVIGKDTQTTDNQQPGSIKDIVFNQQGQVFALVDIGNNRWAVIPWQAVKPESAKGNENVVIETTQKALQSGPAVSQDQWGALDNPKFVKAVYSYYHVQEPTIAQK